ncbi:MAG: recombinase family protein [Firmicutes bacterium]|nr:recombinase family protein [Bacillota bacterium]
MEHVAVYARVSSEDQQERGTIENQVEFATKYCDLHQLNIVAWYKDDGVTGTIPLEQRPEGARLLEDAKAGKFDLLLIYRLDRLGRSARIILNAVYELEQHGVKIRSMTEPFDTGDPNGRFLLTILAGVADLERETILERMWYGANRAARAGKWLGGIVPYGYRVNDEGYLEICEDPLPGLDMSEADVIRLIYRLTADQGYSTIKVADYLNALGVPPAYIKDRRQVRRGKRKENTAGVWRPSRIRGIMTNTTYKGIHYYGKRTRKKRDIIPREVPAIVSEELWEKAQHVLHNNQLEAPRNSRREYLLRGLIKCGVCGLTYCGTAYLGPKGELKGYYVCGGKVAYRGPFIGRCPSKNVPQKWIEDLVWNDCVTFIQHPGEALQELAASMKVRESQEESLRAEQEAISGKIRDKENEKQRILELYRKRLITALDVEQQLQNIQQEKKSLEHRLKDLDRQISEEHDLFSQFKTAEDLLDDLREKLKGNPSFKVRREIVRTLVHHITVNSVSQGNNRRPKVSVTIHYTFSNGVVCTDARAGSSGTHQDPVVAAPRRSGAI